MCVYTTDFYDFYDISIFCLFILMGVTHFYIIRQDFKLSQIIMSSKFTNRFQCIPLVLKLNTRFLMSLTEKKTLQLSRRYFILTISWMILNKAYHTRLVKTNLVYYVIDEFELRDYDETRKYEQLIIIFLQSADRGRSDIVNFKQQDQELKSKVPCRKPYPYYLT